MISRSTKVRSSAGTRAGRRGGRNPCGRLLRVRGEERQAPAVRQSDPADGDGGRRWRVGRSQAGEQDRPLGEADPGDDVRRRRRRARRAVHDGAGVDDAVARHGDQRQVIGHRPQPVHSARGGCWHVAEAAGWHGQPVLAGRVPPVGGSLVGGRTSGGPWSSADPQDDGGVRGQDAAGAVGDARRAPGTWRSPHSPRSCRTASISSSMPYCPGGSRTRPPPEVFERQVAPRPDPAVRR